MSKALEKHAVPKSEISFINRNYLVDCRHTSDPTMVWGTDIDAGELLSFLKQRNSSSDVILSAAHVLIKAVGQGLAQFPQLNSRVVGGRIYRFKDVNVRMVSYNGRTSDVDIITMRQADQASLCDIGRFLWNTQLEIASGRYPDHVDKTVLYRTPGWLNRLITRTFWWLDRNFRLPRLGRIDRHLESSVLVNFLGCSRSPSMKMYKPSKFPDESSLLSVTMGRVEEKPVVRDGCVVVRPVAPLFFRADHRVTDANELSRFICCLRDSLENPSSLVESPEYATTLQRQAA